MDTPIQDTKRNKTDSERDQRTTKQQIVCEDLSGFTLNNQPGSASHRAIRMIPNVMFITNKGSTKNINKGSTKDDVAPRISRTLRLMLMSSSSSSLVF